jgi:hypothetical protein
MRVDIAFEYTIDDLREGLRAPEHARPLKRPTRFWNLFGWVLFTGLAVMFYILLDRQPGQQRIMGMSDWIAPPPVDLIVSLGPSYAAAAMVGVLVLLAVVLTRLRGKKAAISRQIASAVAAVTFLLVAGIAWAFLHFDQTPQWAMASPSRALLLAIAVAPWIVLFALMILLLRRATAWQWKAKPSLRRRRHMILDNDGLENGDEVAVARYHWPYFTRAWETENLLVIVDENRNRQILPKRAFADAGEVGVARALIGSHVADSKFAVAPTGFPVAPLPVQPLKPAAAEVPA